MSWTRFILTLSLLVAVTVSAAVMQGRMRNRWGASDKVHKAAARLLDFPRDFGDWHMVSASELDDDSRRQLECEGATDRVYTNEKTGDKVSLVLILGPTGPTAVHTPEICIGQRDYAASGERRDVAIGNSGDRFWGERFKSKNVHGESLSAYWAWNATGNWVAAKDARYTFAGRPFLYKAQVMCVISGVPDDDSHDAGERFLKDFVPVAAKYTVPDLKD